MRKERLPSDRTAAECGGGGPEPRRRGYLICGAALILAGGAWIAAAVSVGYWGYAPLGGSLLGVGAGLLIKWSIRPKKHQDLRDVPPPPKWW